jgi:hypothetical protein
MNAAETIATLLVATGISGSPLYFAMLVQASFC